MSDYLSRTVTLTLTEYCNLSCIYCYESNKSKSVLTFDTAKKIIDSEFVSERNKDVDIIIFELFGGEPFSEFKLMKDIVAYIKSKKRDTKYRIFITTNGTLVKEEQKKWLLENKDVVIVGLSLDGTKEMHDINRSFSFDQIDISFFAKEYPTQSIKMTISEQTLKDFAKGVIFIHENGFKINCNLAYGIDWSDSKYAKVLHEQLEQLISYYLEHRDIEPCSMLNYRIEGIGIDTGKKKTARRWCGTGNMHTYDVNGNCYPCQFFMPLSVHENSRTLDEVNIPEEIPLHMFDKKCQKCVMNESCPTCYGSNYCESGDYYYKSDSYCNMIKIILLANSYYKWQLLKSGCFENDENKKMLLLRGIETIQDYLSKDKKFISLLE